MTADENLVALAEQYGDEIDPALTHGALVRVRSFCGLTASTGIGRVRWEDGEVVVEVQDMKPAAHVWGGAA